MNVVMIIPTGIGCEIGGHAGDATPVARLLASVCDTLILHPNVVNASDINEMPENSLYVEGSMLDNFLEGHIGLQRVKSNKILVVVNKPVHPETINAISATRVTLGIDVFVVELTTPLRMLGCFCENGKAEGKISGEKELIKQISQYDFDALAIATEITVHRDIALTYFREGGVNPWGGVEAKLSKIISREIMKPVAHAPVEFSTKDDSELYFFNEIVDSRIAPEIISNCYLHCVLKGLHRAPRIGNEIHAEDIDCMVTPIGCYGRPHRACIKRNIPMISVNENENIYGNKLQSGAILVESYLEAAGVIATMNAGITIESVRRPINLTQVVYDE